MKINLIVIFGGKSVEHEVSIISAVQAMHSINKEKYNIIPLYITKQNQFYTGDVLFDIDRYKNLKNLLNDAVNVTLLKADDGVYLAHYKKKMFKNNIITKVDVALPVVHGTNVEDGALQGMLETLELPYAGCDVAASAIGMDKYVMKTVLKDRGLKVLDCVCFFSKEFYKKQDSIISEIEQKIGYPVIVKPVNLGSSVGIAKAKDKKELVSAIETAAGYAHRILVERAVVNLREINCSVKGDYETAMASPCEEPVGSDEILSYKDKYLGSGTKGMSGSGRKLPAEIGDELTEKVRNMAVATFRALDCSGVARIDFLLDGEEVYINEINTIPGSLSFYLWEAAGVSYTALLDELVSIALKRERERRNLNFSYETNLLSSVSLKGLKGSKRS